MVSEECIGRGNENFLCRKEDFVGIGSSEAGISR